MKCVFHRRSDDLERGDDIGSDEKHDDEDESQIDPGVDTDVFDLRMMAVGVPIAPKEVGCYSSDYECHKKHELKGYVDLIECEKAYHHHRQ